MVSEPAFRKDDATIFVPDVPPTPERMGADPLLRGRGVVIAFLDSGFSRHPDLTQPDRILAYHDVTHPGEALDGEGTPEAWRWHGTQTSVVAAGDGALSKGVYRGLASEARLVLVKVGREGSIKEPDIVAGFEWVLANRERYAIRVLNVSLGGDVDAALSESRINQLAEEAVRAGLVVVVAAGNSGCGDRPRPVPPATAPSVITVGGVNDPSSAALALYCSSWGTTADGNVKPEVLAPAMRVAAPLVLGSPLEEEVDALSRIAAAPDSGLRSTTWLLLRKAGLGEEVGFARLPEIRRIVKERLSVHRAVAGAYQAVEGTSFAAPIVSSLAAQMLEAAPTLTPAAIKHALIATADRVQGAAAARQGYGVVNAARAVALVRRDRHLRSDLVGTPPFLENGHVVFTFHHDTAWRVELCTDFRGHLAFTGPYQKRGDGLWEARVPSPQPGRYRYKLIVDGEHWIEDPSHGLKEADGYGGFNSVLHVGWEVR